MLAYQTYDLATVLLLIILLVGAFLDLRSKRLPNWLTGSALLSGIILHTLFLGWGGLGSALGGAAVGFLCLIPFYLTGGMGAGDVKFMAAIGSFLASVKMVALAASAGLVFAGVYAAVRVSLKGGWSTLIKRYAISYFSGQYIQPPPDDVSRERFPFALAIAAGTLVVLAWHGLLDFYFLTTQINYQLQEWGVTL